MNEQWKRPLTIAFCGVDGVGKTSLFRMLSERLKEPEFVFVSRGPSDSERLIERRFPRLFGDWRDWVEGEHAEALALACAMDYGVFYDRQIKPLLEAERSEHPRAIITDRHAICFLAYARCNRSPNSLAVTLLETFPPPDVIFYLTVPEDVVQERIKADPNHKFDEWEAVEPQRLMLESYRKLLRPLSDRVINVDNTGPIDVTCERIAAEISNLVSRGHAHAR